MILCFRYILQQFVLFKYVTPLGFAIIAKNKKTKTARFQKRNLAVKKE